MAQTASPMAQTAKRTPVETTENVSRGRGRPKQTAIYQKTMSLTLTGSNPKELQKVAASLHKSSHPLTVGGKTKRKVTVKFDPSTTPTKIFDGVI